MVMSKKKPTSGSTVTNIEAVRILACLSAPYTACQPYLRLRPAGATSRRPGGRRQEVYARNVCVAHRLCTRVAIGGLRRPAVRPCVPAATRESSFSHFAPPRFSWRVCRVTLLTPAAGRCAPWTVAAGSNSNAGGPSKMASKLDAETEELSRALLLAALCLCASSRRCLCQTSAFRAS